MATNDDTMTSASAAAGTTTEDLPTPTNKNEEPVEAGGHGHGGAEDEVDDVDEGDEQFKDALLPEDSIMEDPKEAPAEGLLLSHANNNNNNNKTEESAEDTTTGVPPEGTAKVEEEDKTQPTLIWEPADADVLSGRGASVNAHGGNKKFRALCFARKPEFDAGNHAAKRRIAHEIVASTLGGPSGGDSTSTTTTTTTTRFLKRKDEKGPWTQMTIDQAILKACQVMRDYKRPDRVAIREMMTQSGNARKRQRTTESTPILEIPIPTLPLAPIIENPFGVHDHDILCGRGAFVNGHTGNGRLRDLALARKRQFDAGNYAEKRSLAQEVVQYIRSLDPPGRFLRRVNNTPPKAIKDVDDNWILPPRGLDGTWEELNDEKAIHKACQVMRDIDRPDRKDRELRRKDKKQRKKEAGGGEDADSFQDTMVGSTSEDAKGAAVASASASGNTHESAAAAAAAGTTTKDSMTMLAETSTTAEKAAVEEAMAATEAALDDALEHSISMTAKV